MAEYGVDVVLFDLGGVLFDFGGVAAMKSLAAIEDDEELWRRWLSCPWVRTFERGHCSAEDFAAGVVAEWDLTIEPDEFLDLFRSWLGGPLDGADDLVEQSQREVRVGCLSNTNAVHWSEAEDRWRVLSAFDVRFLSFQMGCVKPDREIFDRVAEALAVARDKVLFLDDNTMNVDGAREAGFNAMRTVGVEGARAHLAARGIVPHR